MTTVCQQLFRVRNNFFAGRIEGGSCSANYGQGGHVDEIINIHKVAVSLLSALLLGLFLALRVFFKLRQFLS